MNLTKNTKRKPYLVFSPGHWENTWENKNAKGIDPANEPKFEEFDFNVDVVEFCIQKLKKYSNHFEKIIQLEYDNDKLDRTLSERINYVNKLKCTTNDLLIAVHANAGKNKLKGQWGFYGSDKGKYFLNLYQKHVHNSVIPYTRTYKCKFDDWTEFGIVLRTKKIVATLIECGFFTNKEDRAILRTKVYKEYIANKIVASILQYYKIAPIKEELTWKEIVDKCTDYPETWINNIETLMKLAETKSDLGDFEALKFLPDLIEKIYKK